MSDQTMELLAKPYEPKGIRFHDASSGRDMVLVDDGERYGGWLCYRHPDGQWVTVRKATDDDRSRIVAAASAALPSGEDRARLTEIGDRLMATFPARGIVAVECVAEERHAPLVDAVNEFLAKVPSDALWLIRQLATARERVAELEARQAGKVLVHRDLHAEQFNAASAVCAIRKHLAERMDPDCNGDNPQWDAGFKAACSQVLELLPREAV